MKLTNIIRNYCQGKFHRIFLLLSVTGISELIIILSLFHFFEPSARLFPPFLVIGSLILFFSVVAAHKMKNLFR